MFEFEFMTGAYFINGIFYSLVIMISLFLFSVLKDINDENKIITVKNTLMLIAIIIMSFMMFNGASRPKNTINLPPNKHQIEYDAPKEVEVITPEPRYENMEGFEPLKKD